MRNCVPLVILVSALLQVGWSTNITDFVNKYAPKIRYDSKAGSDGYCFPSSAGDYYEARKNGTTHRICNQNYTTVQQAEIPTYYKAQVCGYHLHISYWSFYAFNQDCDCCSGKRDAWFENIVIKVRDFETDPRMHEVRFGQKNGWYTRIPGHYETTSDGHPVAYVGRGSHGFYHDDGGSGTCCYYEDFRNPSSANQFLETWTNLVEFTNTTTWMNDTDTAVWNGIHAPPFRGDYDLCKLNGCNGAIFQLCTKSGCAKSDTNDDPF